VAAIIAGLVAVSAVAPAYADAGPAVYPPPYIDHTEWVHRGGLASLRVYPTRAGRAQAHEGAEAQGEQAWAEILADAPDADSAGMRDQFLCHWDWAELVEPGKASWNLEPWRPVVDADQMLAAGCNPGGSEEP
jgi:Protein of unknown function (DUF2599)